MSIVEPDKIDMVLTDKEKTYVILVIADHLDWDKAEDEHLVLFQNKFNVYLHFVESGQLNENRPDLAGLPVTIRVAAKFAPSEEALKLCHLFGKDAAQVGASLELEVPSTATTMRF